MLSSPISHPGASGRGVCSAGPPVLKIDNSSAPDVYNASTDGVLLIRYLLGLRRSTLTQSALRSKPQRSAAQIEAYIAENLTLFDVDADGSTKALTDGLMFMRRMLGLAGAALASGARIPVSVRSDSDIANAIDALKP